MLPSSEHIRYVHAAAEAAVLAAVPVPLLIRSSVPGAYPQHTAGYAVQAVVVAARGKVHPVAFGIEILPVHIEALSAFIVYDLANAHMGAEIIGVHVITITIPRRIPQQVAGGVA